MVSVLSFKIDLEKSGDLQACASIETNNAIGAIASCDQADQLKTVDCIVKVLNNSLTEKWDAWIRSYGNTDGLNYWTWNSCNITYTNYGKYNRSFVLWTAQNYSYVEQKNMALRSKELRTVRGAKTNGQCTDWEVWNAYYYINNCDNAASTTGALCIYNSMLSKLNQKWNVWVSSSTDKSALTYWSTGCEIEIDGFGRFSKDYFLWKAE